MTMKKRAATKKGSTLASAPEPERSAEEQAVIDQWLDGPDPLPKVEKGKEGALNPTSADHRLWGARILKAVGVVDGYLALKLVNQATQAVRGGEADAKWNLAMASIQSIGPRDGVEAMLAAQMVGTHNAAMEMLQRLILDQPSLEVYDSVSTCATKLLRTYAAQVEALNRYRNAGQQQVVVKHVSVTADKAAFAIACTTGGPGGASLEIGEQPYAPVAITHEPVASMLCPDAAGQTLSVTCSEGAQPMPDARRG